MSDTGRSNGSNSLLRLIIGAAIVLVGLHLYMVLFWNPEQKVALFPWVIIMLGTVMIMVASSVSFLAFVRYRVLRDSVSYWTGMGFAAFSVGCVFYVLAWPGLRPSGAPFIGQYVNTSPWEALSVITVLGLCLLAADLCPWPSERSLPDGRWLWLLLAWLLIVALGGVLTLWLESKLPLLIIGSGQFTTLALSWAWSVILLFSWGAVLSARRYLRVADTLTGHVSFTQMVIACALLMAIYGGNRYSFIFFLGRLVVIAGFLVTQFGLLSEYVQLFLWERERRLVSEQTAVVLQESQERLTQAHERLERANLELERRVAERTAHLEEQRVELEQRNDELESAYRSLESQSEMTIRAMQEVHEKDWILAQQMRVAAMGELLMNIAHHWRQPLNILGLIMQELAMQHGSGGPSAGEIEDITKQGMKVLTQMSCTIDEFASFYRPDGERTTFQVNGLLARMISMLDAAFHELQIKVDLVDDGEVFVYGYSNQFFQALLNIMLNARDAFVSHPVREPHIAIHVFENNGRGVITISDNAGGIPAGLMEKIFDPYFTTKGPDKGIGIGLYMARIFIEKNMNGSLTVANTEEGAEFRIEMVPCIL